MGNHEAPPAGLIARSDRPPVSGGPGRWRLMPIAALAALPLAVAAVPYTFAVRAAAYLGLRPYHGQPDREGLREESHPSDFLELLIPALVFLIETALAVLLVERFARPERRLRAIGSIAGALWLLSIATFFLDPLGVLEWILEGPSPAMSPRRLSYRRLETETAA
jgi:hypothetical protein